MNLPVVDFMLCLFPIRPAVDHTEGCKSESPVQPIIYADHRQTPPLEEGDTEINV